MIPNFKEAGGNSGELSEMVKKLRSFVSGSKDWFAITDKLDNVLLYMRNAIQEYEDKQRRKREEEERKRRNSYHISSSSSSYSSSSSSDSSSSFGGFGGGSFGGGGSPGDW